MKKDKKVLFAISFDGVSMSGITVEFIKVAHVFHQNGYQIFFDLGYEIKADKENFFKPYSSDDHRYFPDWMRLIRVQGLQNIAGYHQDFVCDFFQKTFSTSADNPSVDERIVGEIADCILNTWRNLDINFVIVENGTLPENVHYTLALYKAIEQYGKENNLKKYVFWRDHDPMWSSESMKKKYGDFPYPETPKPCAIEFIRHVVLHGADYEQMKKWAPETDLTILPNSFTLETKKKTILNCNFRKFYNIPKDAILLARYTRIILQKRIDREIYLLDSLRKLFKTRHIDKEIYLFVAGNKNENPDEFARLIQLTKELDVEHFVIFEDTLLPYDVSLLSSQSNHYSVKDLLMNSDLACFLTSYDYESYGNPIGEAIACETPFVATSYSRYYEVYGRKGIEGIILSVNEKNDFITGSEAFSEKVFEFLMDHKWQDAVVKKNTEIAKRHFSIESLEKKIKTLLQEPCYDN